MDSVREDLYKNLWKENVLFCFFQLQILNCGNNDLEELPEVIEHLTMLEKLHLFNNKISSLSPKVLSEYYA